jgi:predicted GH43/DUF377 family glycosyl hydrolase
MLFPDIIDGIRVILILLIIFGVLLAILALLRPTTRAHLRDGIAAIKRRIAALRLSRTPCNPILAPDSNHHWESHSVFNPAAILIDDTVHLFYRAIGDDGISRWGHATSTDGLHFGTRSETPVFAMLEPRAKDAPSRRFDPVLYPSGGSWGGAEDPRAVRIDDDIYVTFNVFDGWDFLRVGATHLPATSLEHHTFDWSDPILLSPPNTINKNWVLFPEKFSGRFAILHSITPDVQIEYVERLEDLGTGTRRIDSRYAQARERGGWDTTWRSAGPPPLKTAHGWLVFYHAHDTAEPHRYKLGAMLLDLSDPTRILHRADVPILTPDAWYENDWKPGIVYACGAIVKDGTLFVYYGGGDKTVNVAQAPLEPFLEALILGIPSTLGSETMPLAG